MPTAADCGEAAAAGQAASYRTGAHLRGEVQLSSIHSSGCPVHSAVYGVSCCVKASFLVELTVFLIVYAACISCSGMV